MTDENKMTERLGKPHEQRMDSASATHGAKGPSLASGPDLAKRRLVRGAAAAAPVLLTLRSGALAAISCTGVEGKDVVVASDGKITVGSGNKAYNSPQVGDVCYNNSNVTYCLDLDLNDHKVQSVGGTPLQVTQNGSDFYCGNGTGSGLNDNYAILSAGSAQSLVQ
jgi:hypothetical protein